MTESTCSAKVQLELPDDPISGRTRPVSNAQARQFAAKAEEFLAAADHAAVEGQTNAAAGNAVDAGISACKAPIAGATSRQTSPSARGPVDQRGPGHIWGINAGASGGTVAITEPNHAKQRMVVIVGGANQFGLDSVQHQRRPTEHEEVAEIVDPAPRQIQESFAAFAVNCRTREIKRTTGVVDNDDIKFPSGRRRVAAHQASVVSANLHSDVHSVERRTVEIAKRLAGQIDPLDDHSHPLSLPPITPPRHHVGSLEVTSGFTAAALANLHVTLFEAGDADAKFRYAELANGSGDVIEQ